MSRKSQKIAIAAAEGIPFNKLVPSPANVRKSAANLRIEALAEDIALRGLIQSLGVRTGPDGAYEVHAGGRRLRALGLLVAQGRMNRSQPIPCIVQDAGLSEEISLAENDSRLPLHPLDQYRAFRAMADKGMTRADIAARFFTTERVVEQRLRLAKVSPALCDLYAADEITLDQMTAFTVGATHAAQEAVWRKLGKTYDKGAHAIRRELTREAARANGGLATFAGIDAYKAAGGAVVEDLFSRGDTDDVYLSDPALLERLATEKLAKAAAEIGAQGWKWVDAALTQLHGYSAGYGTLTPVAPNLSPAEDERHAAILARMDEIVEEHSAADEMPDEADAEYTALAAELGALESKSPLFTPAQMQTAGVFVWIKHDGTLAVDPGFVRAEDIEAAPAVQGGPTEAAQDGEDAATATAPRSAELILPGAPPAGEEEEDQPRPLSDRLLSELSAFRTLALRDRLAQDFDTAFLASLHAMASSAFYHSSYSCLELRAPAVPFPIQPEGLSSSPPAQSNDARDRHWREALPKDIEDLWDALAALDQTRRQALFAHCVAQSANAIHNHFGERPVRFKTINQTASACGLDLAAAGWTPTAASYLGRVSKKHILEAVAQACGPGKARLLEHLKKGDMAREAERMLAGTGWLPQALRNAEDGDAPLPETSADEPEAALPDFLSEETGDSEAGLDIVPFGKAA